MTYSQTGEGELSITNEDLSSFRFEKENYFVVDDYIGLYFSPFIVIQEMYMFCN